MPSEPTNAEMLPGEYLAAYRRAMNAMEAITAAIHDMPAPESESVTWGSVADTTLASLTEIANQVASSISADFKACFLAASPADQASFSYQLFADAMAKNESMQVMFRACPQFRSMIEQMALVMLTP